MTAGEDHLNELTGRWEDDVETLRFWGHPEQAKVVEICVDELRASLSSDGRSVQTLADDWDDEARVLAEYGHDSQAEALWHCADVVHSATERSESGGAEDRLDEREAHEHDEAPDTKTSSKPDQRPQGEPQDRNPVAEEMESGEIWHRR